MLRVAAGLASLCPECRRRGRRSACVRARHRVPCRVHPRACRESVAVRPGEPWLWSTVAPVVQQVRPPRRAVSSVAALPLCSRQAAFAEELARGPTIAHAATKQPLMGWTDCFSVDYPFAENPPGTKWLERAS